MRIRHVALTDPGRRHTDNQDSVLAVSRDGFSLLAVADGVGGLAAGAAASQTTIRALEEGIDRLGKEPPDAVLRTQLERANSELYEQHHGRPGKMSGSTIVALVFRDESVLVAHVGDSRAYLCRDGSLRRLTEDHSLVAEQVKAGILTPEQAANSKQRHVITRSLGVASTVEIDVEDSLPYRAGDLFLLCSDGLSDVVPDSDLELMLAGGVQVGRTASDLIAVANERGGPDNISVVLARILEDGDE
jgi:protein phosphatase